MIGVHNSCLEHKHLSLINPYISYCFSVNAGRRTYPTYQPFLLALHCMTFALCWILRDSEGCLGCSLQFHTLPQYLANRKETDLPVVITIAKSPNRDLKGLPHWVQRVLHHLCLVADGKPAERETRRDADSEKKKSRGGRKRRLVRRERGNRVES